MRSPSDESAIPIPLACELAAVSRQVRTTWIDRTLVLGDTKGGCTRAELLDLVCFAQLVDRLGFDDARLVWPQVAALVRDQPDGSLWIVVDLQLKRAAAVRTDAQIGAAAKHGRPVKVVALHQQLAEVAAAFHRVVTTLAETEPRPRR